MDREKINNVLTENELALYIDKFLTLIIKHATEYRKHS